MTLFVAGMILIDKRRVLLQLRDNKSGIDYSGMWTIPGGVVSNNESTVDAARREFEEETGYKVENCHHLVDLNYIAHKKMKLFCVFFADYIQGRVIQCFEGQEMRWIDLDNVDKLKIVPVAKKALVILREKIGSG